MSFDWHKRDHAAKIEEAAKIGDPVVVGLFTTLVYHLHLSVHVFT